MNKLYFLTLLLITTNCTSTKTTTITASAPDPKLSQIIRDVTEQRTIIKYKRALYIYDSTINLDIVDSIYQKFYK